MIYFVSIGNYVSGGPETLHQAAALFASMGQQVGMYYIHPHTMHIPDRFKKYNIAAVDKIVDIEDNILIVPETKTYILSKYKRLKKCIWWLSLENYLNTEPILLTNWRMRANHWPKIMFPVAWTILVAKGKIHTYRYHFEDKGQFFHTYNCEYAHRYIVEHGVPEHRTLYLCGPLNASFFERARTLKNNKRGNIVLYNPKKGVEFTQKLIAAAKDSGLDAEFKPIQGMTPDQISELMSRSKIYIDFGNFPGPERIPREAVTMGCNIITSRNGSAANDIDVPIPDDLKFEDNEDNIPTIIRTLQDMLENYNAYYHYYDIYREKVVGQINLLKENAALFLERV